MGGDSPDTKSTPKGAVFISYASQDSVEAQQIADALRKEGVEAWFDRSELRGGDAWDGLIRRQIHDCRLFIAIISSHTESRDEGYFRREWKLAVERTHDLAEDVPFLIPVVIDDTREATARVPDRFREVHWTRLTDQRPADLAVRIRSLMGRQGGESRDHRPDAAHAFELRPPRRRFGPAIAGMLVIAVVLAGIIEYERRPPTKSKSQVTTSTAVPDSAGAPLRSIAVLPFVNMSGDPNQEYFSDGLTEELIDLLIRSTDLRVPASTSSFYFKGKQATIAQIASALSVSYVLEGSVRKSGNTLRVTAQLVRAGDGYHLWSNSFDRELKDVFKVQDDIAASVVAILKSKLSMQPEKLAAHRTSNVEAHDEYLIGRQLLDRSGAANYQRAFEAFSRSVELDPSFVPARVGRADARYLVVADALELTPQIFGQIVEELGQVIALAPDISDGYSARGVDVLEVRGDLGAAAADLERALAIEPDSTINLRRYAFLLRCRGDYQSSLKYATRAVDADPLDVFALHHLGSAQIALGQYEAARVTYAKAAQISGESGIAYTGLATAQLLLGQSDELLKWIDQHPYETERAPLRSMGEYSAGRQDDSRRTLETYLRSNKVNSYDAAETFAWRHEYPQAFEWLGREAGYERGVLSCIGADPLFASLRQQPQFNEFMRKHGLAN